MNFFKCKECGAGFNSYSAHICPNTVGGGGGGTGGGENKRVGAIDIQFQFAEKIIQIAANDHYLYGLTNAGNCYGYSIKDDQWIKLPNIN